MTSVRRLEGKDIFLAFSTHQGQLELGSVDLNIHTESGSYPCLRLRGAYYFTHCGGGVLRLTFGRLGAMWQEIPNFFCTQSGQHPFPSLYPAKQAIIAVTVGYPE